jgi:hypothetical protein
MAPRRLCGAPRPTDGDLFRDDDHRPLQAACMWQPGGISEEEMPQYGWNPQHFRAAVRQFRSRLEAPPTPTPRQKAAPDTPPQNYLTMKQAGERLGMRPGNFWSLAQR